MIHSIAATALDNIHCLSTAFPAQSLYPFSSTDASANPGISAGTLQYTLGHRSRGCTALAAGAHLRQRPSDAGAALALRPRPSAPPAPRAAYYEEAEVCTVGRGASAPAPTTPAMGPVLRCAQALRFRPSAPPAPRAAYYEQAEVCTVGRGASAPALTTPATSIVLKSAPPPRPPPSAPPAPRAT